ncbi:MAG TPA: hypothetical protein VER04_00555 [Polyangiaceae bacterium]|nr:hypothetical protein [Polyangiaceae bacterium]
MGGELRPRPIVVPQGSAPQCWAAATTSWLQLNKSRPQLNKQQLLDRYGDPNKGGSLGHASPKWDTYCSDLNLVVSEVRTLLDIEGWKQKAAKENPSRPPLTPGEAVALFNAQAKKFADSTLGFLSNKGYGLFMFAHTHSRLRGTISHMVVLFGVHRVDGEPNLIVMDPAKAAIRDLPMSEIFNIPIVILSTREARTPKDLPVAVGVPSEDT